MTPLVFWTVFHAVIVFFLLLDLFVFHRDHHAVTVREAAWTSAFWIGVALAFNAGVAYVRGTDFGVEFLAAYLLEKSLSMDNLFVFYLLFRHFGVRREDEHSLLFCGVVGAIVMRAALILAGVQLVHRFHFLFYVFGAFLVWSGVGMWRSHGAEEEEGKVVRLLRRFLRVAPPGARGFFMRGDDGKVALTTGAFALVAIELSDLLFALDSIPAVLGITHDFATAYTSNILAILGLRALYFLLAGMIGRFRRLHYGLAFVLVFIGGKMLVMDLFHVPTWISLGVIAASVGGAVAWDLASPEPAESTE